MSSRLPNKTAAQNPAPEKRQRTRNKSELYNDKYVEELAGFKRYKHIYQELTVGKNKQRLNKLKRVNKNLKRLEQQYSTMIMFQQIILVALKLLRD